MGVYRRVYREWTDVCLTSTNQSTSWEAMVWRRLRRQMRDTTPASGCQNNTNCKDTVICAGGCQLTDTTNLSISTWIPW